MNLSEIQAKVEEAAQAIITLPPDRWTGWVVYLLETLREARVTVAQFDKTIGDLEDLEEDYQDMLRNVGNNIKSRLEVGKW